MITEGQMVAEQLGISVEEYCYLQDNILELKRRYSL